MKIYVKISFKRLRYQWTLNFDKNKTFEDLYNLIDIFLVCEGNDPKNVEKFPKISGIEREPIKECKVIEVLEANNLSGDMLELSIVYCGIGGSELLDGKLKLEIRANEPAHHRPHVHITNREKNSVSIAITRKFTDNDIIEGRETWENIKKKDRRAIIEMLDKYHSDFETFYLDQTVKHLVPEDVTFVYKGETHILSYNRQVVLK